MLAVRFLFQINDYSKKPEKHESWFPQKYQAAQLFSTMIRIGAANQHIRMMNCDTKIQLYITEINQILNILKLVLSKLVR